MQLIDTIGPATFMGLLVAFYVTFESSRFTFLFHRRVTSVLVFGLHQYRHKRFSTCKVGRGIPFTCFLPIAANAFMVQLRGFDMDTLAFLVDTADCVGPVNNTIRSAVPSR